MAPTSDGGALAALAGLRRGLGGFIWAFAAAFVLAYAVADQVFVAMARPLIAAWQAHDLAGPPQLYFTSLAGPFYTS
jgi:Sec-independent protein secretion pathway component TatC